jgi:hypothetical protein
LHRQSLLSEFSLQYVRQAINGLAFLALEEHQFGIASEFPADCLPQLRIGLVVVCGKGIVAFDLSVAQLPFLVSLIADHLSGEQILDDGHL